MKVKSSSFIITLMFFSFLFYKVQAQSTHDSINSKRLWITTGALGVGYGSSTYLLNRTWYQDYPRSSFHLFNDWGEWNNMDKIGHVFASQFQSNYAFHLYQWAGVDKEKAIWYGSITALLFQSTIEVLDGFSTEWGFSLFDFGANVAGSALFASQQSLWGQQKIILKVSGGKRKYSTSPLPVHDEVSLSNRADDLFGSGKASRFLKDYNAQTYWVSINLRDLKLADTPAWFNMSFGYGSENLFGGFDNSWMVNDQTIRLSNEEYPRYHQFYISPDIDLSKIKTKSPFVKAILGVLNIFKVPLPTLEITSQGDVIFHFLKF